MPMLNGTGILIVATFRGEVDYWRFLAAMN